MSIGGGWGPLPPTSIGRASISPLAVPITRLILAVKGKTRPVSGGLFDILFYKQVHCGAQAAICGSERSMKMLKKWI
jgi:hypothetical protein